MTEKNDISKELLKLGFAVDSSIFGVFTLGATKYRLKLFTDEDTELEIKTNTLEHLNIFRRSEKDVYLDVVLLDSKNYFYGCFNAFLTIDFYLKILGQTIRPSISVKLPFKQYGELRRFINFMQ
jgi:hypothetical protein